MADLAAQNFLLERKNDLLKQLISVMNTTPKLDNILKYILDLITMSTTSEACVMMTKASLESENLMVRSVVGLDKKLVGKEYPMSQGLVSECFCTSREKIINSPASDPGYDPHFNSFIGYDIRNMIVVPMIENKNVGAIGVFNKKDGMSFGAEDLEMAMILAEQAASLAGESAALRSTEAKVARFNTLLAVSREITQQSDLHKLLQLIMESAKKVMRADASSLFLLDEKAKELYIESAQGDAGEMVKTIRLPVGKGIAGWVAQYGKPQLIVDAYEDNRFNSDWDKKTGYRTKSIICVPLEYKRKITGVIQIINALDKETFEDDDMDYMLALAGQAAVAIENARLLIANKEQFMGLVMAMVKVVDSRHQFFAGHSLRVASYGMATAREMGLPPSELEKVQVVGLLHDVGRMQIPDQILAKPGKLVEQEMKYITMQPVLGAKILQGIRMLDYAVPAILCHMEHFNGKGYPKGLQGEQIPILSRIISVCNVFDAMCSPRPYHPQGMDPQAARGKISAMAGSQFDPLVVKAFVQAYDTGKIKR